MAQAPLFGDVQLAAGLRQLLRGVHPVAAVAVVAPGLTRTASYGAELVSQFEIGGLSEALTGLLYADALGRGAVAPTTLLGDVLPLAGSDAARASLGSLAAHASGLPRVAAGTRTLTSTLEVWARGTNAYGESLDELLERTRRTPVGHVGRHSSSLLGYELLGHALAAVDGTTYADLLRRRLVEPLGLDSTYAATSVDDLRARAIRGRTRGGRPRDSWAGEALGPAAGIRSTVGDLLATTVALLDGTAPGVRALEPVEDYAGPGSRIGAGWRVAARQGRELTWQHGRTGGFASWWGLDRAAGTGVVILSGASASVDRHGVALLDSVRP